MAKGKRNGAGGAPLVTLGHGKAAWPVAAGAGGGPAEYNYRLRNVLAETVLPPLRAGQFRVWWRGATPIAWAAWALLDEATERRLLGGETRLGPGEWCCGDRP